MARRKKYQKLPNGYGQIRYLGKGRRNPYGVYPPAGDEYDNGQKKAPKALCYVSSRMAALAVLIILIAVMNMTSRTFLHIKGQHGISRTHTKKSRKLLTEL